MRIDKRVFVGSRATDIDPASLRVLAPGVLADRAAVYFGGRAIDGIDPAKARVRGRYVWDDRRAVFLELDPFGFRTHAIPDVHLSSFEVLASGVFARDRERLFLEGRVLDVPPDARPLSSSLLQLTPLRHAFLRGRAQPIEVIDGPAKVLGGAFVITDTTVYWGGEAVDFDASSFALLSEVEDALSSHAAYFVRDSRGVSFVSTTRGIEALEVDPSRFQARGRYGADGQAVYFQGIPLEEVDAPSFEPVGASYARDANHVYSMASVVEELDAPTVELCATATWTIATGPQHEWCQAVLKDVRGVWLHTYFDSDYSCGDAFVAFEEADPGSYVLLDPSTGLASDDDGLWLGTQRIAARRDALRVHRVGSYWQLGDRWWHGTTPLKNVAAADEVDDDHAIFRLADSGPVEWIGDGFLADRFTLWHRGHRLDEVEVEPGAMKSLGSGFLRSGGRVFHFEEVMTSRKVVTYESLGGELDEVEPDSFVVLSDGYAADARFVYYGAVATGIDRGSLELLAGGWARDAGAVYCLGQPIDAERDGLRVLGGTQTNHYAGGDHGAYATDGHRVYRGTRLLTSHYGMQEVDVDAASFSVLSPRFGHDGRHVYDLYTPRVVPELHAASFEALGGAWGRDRAQLVWLDGRFGLRVIEGVDLESVVALGDVYVRDAGAVYALGARTEIDPSSVRVVQGPWAIDRTGVWFAGTRVEQTDAPSFGPSDLAPGLMQDDHAVYGPMGRSRLAVARVQTRSLGNGGHWVGGDTLYWGLRKVGSAGVSIQVLGGSVVRSDGQVYFEDVSLAATD